MFFYIALYYKWRTQGNCKHFLELREQDVIDL